MTRRNDFDIIHAAMQSRKTFIICSEPSNAVKVSFKYGDRLSVYIFDDQKIGHKKHMTVFDAGEKEDNEIRIDVYEPDPETRKKLREFLIKSGQIMESLYSEELFSNMFVMITGVEGSKRDMEALFELYNGTELTEDKIDELRSLLESMNPKGSKPTK